MSNPSVDLICSCQQRQQPSCDALPTQLMKAAKLPTDWAEFAVRPVEPWTVDPDEIAADRDEWLTEWSDLISR